jgi:monoterpene epsilon-lactone hydrolase
MASKENLRARQLWAELLAALTPPDRELTPDELRAGYENWATTNFPTPPELRTEPVDADGVPCVWASMPGTATERTIFYLHGGGYVIGSPNGYRGFAASLSQAADARVLLIDYRLAPENPHPAGLQDATTAYRWLVKQEADPAYTVVAGDSAGGGLTIALLAAMRDAGDRLPAAAVCMSPWVDMTLSAASVDDRAELDPIVSRPLLENMAGAYLMGQDPQTPSASPLFADLSGLPPILILVGTSEALHDDSTRLADRAREAGVDVTLRVADEMYHVWPAMSSFLPEAREAVQEIGQFVQSRTSRPAVV